jgi:GTP cyclohydrolase II
MSDKNLHELFNQEYASVQQHDFFKIIGPIKIPIKLSNGNKTKIKVFLFVSEREEYLVCLLGDPQNNTNVLCRVSSACVFGFILKSLLCDCHDQFEESMHKMLDAGGGILIYCHSQHGKGIGLEAHFLVYAEGQRREKGLFSEIYSDLGLALDYRNYEDTAQIIKYMSDNLHFNKITMLTEAPDRINFFEQRIPELGMAVEFGSFSTKETAENSAELTEKRQLGYRISKQMNDSVQNELTESA